jgi:hypothetical protein
MLARGIPAALSHTVPLAAGSWAALTSSMHSVPAGFGGILDKDRIQFETIYRTTLTSHVQVTAGTLGTTGLYVTGIVRVRDPGSSFWITDPVAGTPGLELRCRRPTGSWASRC